MNTPPLPYRRSDSHPNDESATLGEHAFVARCRCGWEHPITSQGDALVALVIHLSTCSGGHDIRHRQRTGGSTCPSI